VEPVGFGGAVAKECMTKRSEAKWLMAIIALGVAIFASTLQGGFTFDDVHSIRGHVGVHGPLSFRNIFWRDYWGFAFEETAGSWRPVATLTYWVDWHVGGGTPWVFHATNLICWAVLLLLVHVFLSQWVRDVLPQRTRLAVVAAFATMAVHIDVVPTATGRTELLAMGFSLAALIVVVRPGKPLRAGAILSSGLFLVLALFSKESAFPMTLVVPWMAWRFQRRSCSRDVRPLAALAGISLFVLAGAVAVRAGNLPFVMRTPGILSDNPIHAMPWFDQRLASAEVFTHYLQHAVTGLDLVPDYSYSAIHVLQNGFGIRTAVGTGLLVALTALALHFHRSRPHVTDAIMGFAGSYLVASHLVVPASAMVADRLFFFPSFWLVLLGALLLDLIPRRNPAQASGQLDARRIVAVGASGWIFVQAVVATAAATVWRDDAVLLTQAIQTYPHVARTRTNLAQVLAFAGRNEEAAWNILLAHAYYARFPNPIPEHEFPLHWDDLPVADRLHALRQQEGKHPFLDAIDRTIDSCSAWNLKDTAAVLRDWRTKADSQNR
jgi:hypothetical protein